MDGVLSVWGKIMIPMYRLCLHGLYGLYGPRCPLSPERPLNWFTKSLNHLWKKTSGNFNRNSNLSLKKIHLKIFSSKWWAYCIGLSVLTIIHNWFRQWLGAYFIPWTSYNSHRCICTSTCLSELNHVDWRSLASPPAPVFTHRDEPRYTTISKTTNPELCWQLYLHSTCLYSWS